MCKYLPKELECAITEITRAVFGNEKYPYMIKYAGVLLVNCTPHPLKFNNGITLQGNQKLAEILRAKPVETELRQVMGIKLVRTDFETTEEGKFLVATIAEHNIRNPDKPVLLISSIISAQAYGFPVVSPIATPETSRKPPNERIVYIDKFNTFL